MNEFVKQKEVIQAVKSMSASMAKIATTGTIDDETLKELEAFQTICGIMTNAK